MYKAVKLYDKEKILAGLIIFLGVITLPVWYALGGNNAGPDPQVSSTANSCVESAEYMRANHMQLLDDWKTSVVRDGIRTYTASDGTEYEISLTGTCLECHPDKSAFCDECHNYAGVSPYCWECHVVTEK